ncbi:hypothetical protein [Thiocystis violascens]|uniref:Uncharacterized protein n=1 Tax=Thiocystis violascens (strain ATCC 17096 / DSM 198 / 6111) TaxID=765911 RepID=I3Y5S2_THIV6|nr:hypothetical protein [Thiocystis violascens]AFL72340.1 hypothetical protein Thivi_0271 [Thiocystis violascens DSM 198]
MTPEEFIANWKGNRLNERAGAQQNFSDLCELLSVEKPRDPDNSRLHERWALQMGSSLEDRLRYTSSSTFRTFPFPEGLTPANTNQGTETLESGAVIPTVDTERRPHAQAIAEAAHRLNALRENWLNPPEWIERIPEVVPGYPERIVPKTEHAAELKKRTLTNLYNTPPAWLVNHHQALDTAVANAYGWSDDTPALSDAEILRRLLALNLARIGSD